MPKYTTKDIRNLVLAGGAFSGKTTLVEHLLHHVGLIPRPGRIEDGNTVCDYDALEKEYKHSLDSALVHFDYHGSHINLIDTPGSADFLGKTISCFPAVETIAVVISAATGVDTVTRRLMKTARERNLPRIIIVNKIDHGDDLAEVLMGIQETFGSECLP
ncbi:MAG TPA: GTP-binding protein, partial [Phycisphaerales bacterium]|nr:GTP-binding protein [Phycisphaerales bacterium]